MLHIKIHILSRYLRLFLTAWNEGGRNEVLKWDIPFSCSVIPSGYIPSHSSCYVYMCSTYSVVNSLMCCSVTIFEDNHLVENLCKDGPVILRTVQCDSNYGETAPVWKALHYEFEVLLLSCTGQQWKRVLKVGTKGCLGKESLEVNCSLLMESFRQAASVCKSLSCNTFVSVAFLPEVQLFILNPASLFSFFCLFF